MYDKDDNYVGYKIRLYPNKEQEEEFKKYFGVSRFMYNWAKTKYEEYYEEAKKKGLKFKSLGAYDLNLMITELCNSEEYSWLKDYNFETLRLRAKDLVQAYEWFFKRPDIFRPKYQSKKNANQQFPIRSERLSIFKDCVQIPSIGYVDSDIVPHNLIGYGNNTISPNSVKYKGMRHIKYTSTRVIFDGCHYYLTMLIKETDDIYLSSQERFDKNEVWKHKQSSDIIGIDVGCKEDNWIVLSNGKRYSRPSQSKEDKKIAGLQKQQARQRRVNAKKRRKVNTNNKKTNCYSKRQEKINYRINKNYKKITNRKKNEIYRCINDILKDKPEAVGIETLRVKSMYKTRKDYPELSNNNIKSFNKGIKIKSFNKGIKNAMINTVLVSIERTLTRNGIPVYHVPKNYPSTKLCSNCGYKYDDIGSKRVFKCPNCGNVIDRDLNASINISNETKRIHYSGKYGNIKVS